MTAALNKQHYRNKGAWAYQCGVMIVAWGTPRGWQHLAYQQGYKAAQEQWKKDNPQGDEFKAGAHRCKMMHSYHLP